MKKTTFMAVSAAVILGLSGCTDAEIAQINESIAEAGNMQQMQNQCKNYVSGQYPSLPRAAISVSPGYNKGNGKTIIPVRINWDEPRVNETGKCVMRDGRVRKYKANY